MITISVAIPCYKSARTIGPVVDELRRVFAGRPEYDYQIILVSDSPEDDTFAAIQALCRNDRKIVGVELSRNFGQAIARMAALPYITGDILVFMDDNGRHPADQIFRLTDKVREGFDLVYARSPLSRRGIFRRLANRSGGRPADPDGSAPRIAVSSYCAMSRMTADALKEYKSPFPSIGSYLAHVVRTCANVDMDLRDRLEGSSRYTVSKTLNMWFNGAINFSTVPLRLVTLIGIVCVCVSVFSAAVAVRRLLDPNAAAGFTTPIALQLGIGGVIMMLLGLCGEYIGRIYMTVSNMPRYEIRTVLNGDTEPRDRNDA